MTWYEILGLVAVGVAAVGYVGYRLVLRSSWQAFKDMVGW